MAFNAGGAAAGASAGAVAGPWGMAAGAVIGGFMGGSSSSGGSASNGSAAATPMAAQAAAMGSGIDGSAWQVTIGNGNTSSLTSTQDKTIRSEGPVASANPSAGRASSPYLDYGYGGQAADPLGLSSIGLGGVPPLVWLLLGGVVLVKLAKRKH
jgi:hypothetical protein